MKKIINFFKRLFRRKIKWTVNNATHKIEIKKPKQLSNPLYFFELSRVDAGKYSLSISYREIINGKLKTTHKDYKTGKYQELVDFANKRAREIGGKP